MRDKTHDEQIERWAKFVRENPNWKKNFKQFSDSQIIIARRFYKNLSRTEEGRKIIEKLRERKISFQK